MLISDLIRVFVANPFLADDADIYADNADRQILSAMICGFFLRNQRETKLE